MRIVFTGVCLAVVALVAAAAGTAAPADSLPNPRLRPIGLPQLVFDWSEDACEPFQIPDLPARAFRDDRGRTQLLLSHFRSFRMVGPSLDQLQVECDPVMSSRLSSRPGRFRDREWIASVYTVDGRKIWALVHDEYQGNRHPGRCPSGSYLRCWYNAITLARSIDGGRTYRVVRGGRRLVAAAPYRYLPDLGPRGVFAPSNVVDGPDGALYVLARIRDRGGRRGTCLLRTEHIARAGSWRAWNGEGFAGRFSNPYLSRPRPRIPCRPVGKGLIAEMGESLTYNTYLGEYLLVGLAPPGRLSLGPKKPGVYFSTSPDLVHWSMRSLVLGVPTKQSFRCGQRSPIAYPSLIDPASPSPTFAVSGQRPFLYYTQMRYRDCRITPERDLVRMPLELVR
ncbi:MAG TPA: hypothetical protein VFX35_10525 [Solirubrobacterales bacterium]|nr:hypothetical protein [Solirubrobacterales bacterium]